MASILEEKVKPGDLIRSEFINDLITEILQIKTKILDYEDDKEGTVIVPSVFGYTLKDARDKLADKTLIIDKVIDGMANLIDPNKPNTKDLVVIGQVPVPNSRTILGSSIKLLVAIKGNTKEETKTPYITHLEPHEVQVKDQIRIYGSNFASDPTDNHVYFDKYVATEVQYCTEYLNVTVPEIDITNGKSIMVNVCVATQNGGKSNEKSCIVSLENEDRPTITRYDPPILIDNKPYIRITGTNLSSDKTRIRVIINDVPIIPDEASSTELLIKVTKELEDMLLSPDQDTVRTKVSVNNVTSRDFHINNAELKKNINIRNT